MNCFEKYKGIYGKDAEYHSFCPYRICPIGAHIDHQLGKITGFALDKGISLAYSPREDGIVELTSLNFEHKVQFNISDVPPHPVKDWADHLRGATLALADGHHISVGLSGVIEGSLPIGGLSSSASVIICFLAALCKINGIKLSPIEMVLTAQRAENAYVGVSCGKLDQSCEIYCKKDNLLFLDTKDDSYSLVPAPANMKPWKIAIFFSGLGRTLASSKYNMRVDEVKSAAYALKAFAGMEYGKYKDTYMRDVPFQVYEQYKGRLPENWRKRAEHYFTEMQRVEEGTAAWRNGDIEKFGRLSFESGRSSIEVWESGSPELKELYKIMTETDGIYGGRFSGAGFKGCCMAIIAPEYGEKICRQVTEKYLAAFPELTGKYSCCICSTADGINLY